LSKSFTWGSTYWIDCWSYDSSCRW